MGKSRDRENSRDIKSVQSSKKKSKNNSRCSSSAQRSEDKDRNNSESEEINCMQPDNNESEEKYDDESLHKSDSEADSNNSKFSKNDYSKGGISNKLLYIENGNKDVR